MSHDPQSGWPGYQAEPPTNQVPAWQPQQMPRRKRHRLRTVLLAVAGVLVVFIAMGAIGAALGAGKTADSGTKAAASSKPSQAATTPAVTATTAPASADSQAAAVVAWIHGSGGAALNELTAALGSFSSIPSGDMSAYGTACSNVGNAVTNALAAPPIPYGPAERWYRQALADYGQGAADCQAGISANSAQTMYDASARITAGTRVLSRATKAIARLSAAMSS